MGYRSEVVLAVGAELMPRFLNVMAQEPGARQLVFLDNSFLKENYDGKGTLLVSWSDVKWYKETYSEVRAIQKFVEDCEMDDMEEIQHTDEHFRFVRLGEDSDDVEEKGSLHATDICIIRSLSF
jgi:hypothetical protein